ncbi:MAG: S8 family serine peptidase [Anaerolineae bacterium]|nr:S8 family serine peptidase [Anaerolineae bacterium]
MKSYDVEQKPINYVPNEVCVVVATEQPVPPARLYEAVRRTLNPLIAQVLEAERPRSRDQDRLQRDLTPTLLRQRHKRGDSRRQVTLEPLRRLDRVDQGTALRPYLPLPVADGETRTLLFYAIQAPRPDGQRDDYVGRVGVVRELVLLLNRHAPRWQPPAVDDVAFRVRSVGPNWLGVGGPHSCGGPGSSPAPIRPGDTRLHAEVDSAAYQGAVASQASGGDVVVAVLDTRPSNDALERAANAKRNPRLTEVASHVLSEATLPMSEAYFAGLPEVDPNYNADPDDATRDFHIPISDHGLFVAGIIADFVPASNIHLYRVLNEYGTGDLYSLATTLCSLPDIYLKDRPHRRLVVNLSLFIDVPAGDRRLKRWLPNSHRAPRQMLSRWEATCRLLDPLDASLHDVIDWLTRSYPGQILIVAAAGNDFRGGQGNRPQTRPPAAYEGVLGVAAVNADAQPSLYSNKADIGGPRNGVAIYGGDAHIDLGNPVGELQVDESAPPKPPIDAVVGIYSAQHFPDGAPNRTGLAYWSGTSFATPFATGIAARTWAANPGMTAHQVLTTVVGFGALLGNAADPDGPLDAPTIFLKQV